MSAEYVYAEDLLTSLVTKSTTYTYTYDKFDLRTSVKIGNRTLATYSYTDEDDGNHLLERLDYGNGNRVEYKYDGLGRVTKEEYYETAEQTEPSRTIRYYYDNAGAIARMKDSATGIETICYYDYAGRVGKLEETDHQSFYHVLLYAYDDNGNVIQMEEYINHQGANSSQIDKYNYYCEYFYDYKNRLEAVDTGDTRKDYVYDSLDRVTNEVVSKVEATGEGESENKVITEVFENEYSYHSATVGQTSVTTYQVASKKTTSAYYTSNLAYAYDDNGNIVSISDGTRTITYEYDTANQLTRENNPYANYTWVWTYDDAGNILAKKEYAYTLVETDELGSAPKTYSYGYGNAEWGDLLTSYNGKTITYDEIGNPLSDGTWTYTWKQGRQLASMTDGRYLWSYSYDANGMRISRNAGSTTYTYVYDGTQLIWMTDGLDQLHFTYDATGRPLTMEYHPVEHSGDSCGAFCGIYYYVTNLQGDVIAILDSSGDVDTEYYYDAWGNPIDVPGAARSFVSDINPLRYRGCVYDRETGLYYLQSRYYNPEIGRFINADVYVSTGQGILGNNMFAYCNNNPVTRADSSGEFFNTVCGALIGGIIALATHDKKENAGDAFLRGFVTGAIAGAALDISIVTAGAGAAIAIAAIGGAAAAAIDYGWEQSNKGEEATVGGYITNAIIGAGFNMLFMGAGRVANRAVGNSIVTVGQALVKNTVKSVTSRAGNFMLKKFGMELLTNTISATVQSGFAKVYSLVADQIGVY